MLRLRSSRLVRVAGAAVLLATLIAVRAHAQEDAPETADRLRTTIDDDLQDRPAEPIKPKRTAPRDSRPSGSGAGQTGYLSTNLPRSKSKAGVKSGRAASAAGRVSAPPKPGARAAQGKAAATPPGKAPVVNPKAAAVGTTLAAARAGGPDAANPGIAGPIPRRLVKPAVEEDAFAPLGIRAGAFLLRPALELTAGNDSNPARTTNGRGSAVLIVAPELQVNSDWERHELTANIRGSYADYPSVHFADRPLMDARVNGRIDVTRDTRVDLETRYILSTENPGSPNLPAGIAKLPIYTQFGGTAAIDQRFNRLDVSLKGTVDRYDYANSLLTDGTSFSNKDRDYNQYGLQARAGYEITPGLKPFVELGVDKRVHDLTPDRFGFDRDSDGIAPKVGTTFEITRKLTGEISVGYLTRTYKDPQLPDLRGLIANSSLVWTATGLTSVKLTATSAADESTIPGVSGLFRRDVGLEVYHAFRRWLLGTLKVGWGLDEYVGLDREDKRYAASVGLIYKLSREMQLRGELREVWLRSNVLGADYTATVLLVGLRLQR